MALKAGEIRRSQVIETPNPGAINDTRAQAKEGKHRHPEADGS